MPSIWIRKQNTSSNKILPFPWLLPDSYFKKLIQYTEFCTSRSSWYVWELSWIGIQEDAVIKLCQFLPVVIFTPGQRISINHHFFIQCWKYIYKRKWHIYSQPRSKFAIKAFSLRKRIMSSFSPDKLARWFQESLLRVEKFIV